MLLQLVEPLFAAEQLRRLLRRLLLQAAAVGLVAQKRARG
jgi:hypothetical protein